MLLLLTSSGSFAQELTLTGVTASIPHRWSKSPISGFQLGLVLKTEKNKNFVLGGSVIDSEGDRSLGNRALDRYKKLDNGNIGDTFSLFNQRVSKRGIGMYLGYQKLFLIRNMKFESEFRFSVYNYTMSRYTTESFYEIVENTDPTNDLKTDKWVPGLIASTTAEETFILPAISASIAPVFEAIEGRLVFTPHLILGYVPNKGMRIWSDELEEYRPLSEGVNLGLDSNGFPFELGLSFGLRYNLKSP